MPFDKSKYPANWDKITAKIRKRSNYTCECQGECGYAHMRYTYDGRQVLCAAPNGETVWRDGSDWYSEEQSAKYIRVKIVLTVGHLNHNPMDCRPKNLRAWCQWCHLHYDHVHHMQNAAETRRKKKIAAGQMELAC